MKKYLLFTYLELVGSSVLSDCSSLGFVGDFINSSTSVAPASLSLRTRSFNSSLPSLNLSFNFCLLTFANFAFLSFPLTSTRCFLLTFLKVSFSPSLSSPLLLLPLSFSLSLSPSKFPSPFPSLFPRLYLFLPFSFNVSQFLSLSLSSF